MNPTALTITDASPTLLSEINRLLAQLTTHPRPLDAPALERLLADPSSTTWVLRSGDHLAGMLTVVVATVPTGTHAWIEDIVVDHQHRGQGLGELLVAAALDQALLHNARHVELTSNPQRTSAHRLYERTGFSRRETNVYRRALDK